MANTPGSIGTIADPISDPYAAGVIQTTTANQLLYQNGFYDPYFRAYDQTYPDFWRFNEWNREFQQFVKNGDLPSLEMIRGLSHDHTGSFGSALGGVNTPELQQADNDYAVGLLVQAVAHSPYAKDTLIIIIEDDSQDGADHVNSHRATTYFVGPYVKQHAVVSTRYSQASVLRTIEDIFGTDHINLNTYYARPMADVFDMRSSGKWTFNAVASTLLKSTTLGLDPQTTEYAKGPDLKPTRDAQYWEAKTRSFDFSEEDQVPAALYNKILWEGIKGTAAPAPVASTRSSDIDPDMMEARNNPAAVQIGGTGQVGPTDTMTASPRSIARRLQRTNALRHHVASSERAKFPTHKGRCSSSAQGNVTPPHGVGN
jgi:hypothetical protein